MRKGAYRIEYSPDARDHLAEMSGRDRAAIADHVDRKLERDPTAATRNRKLLRANDLAPWELRIVLVKAVGRKERHRVLIAGEEIDL